TRPRVQFEIEQSELALKQRIGERRQHLMIAHRRFRGRVDEVELQLEARHRPVGLEREVVEHQPECVETTTDLPPIAHAILPRKRHRRDVLTHARCSRRPTVWVNVTSTVGSRSRDELDSYHLSVRRRLRTAMLWRTQSS